MTRRDRLIGLVLLVSVLALAFAGASAAGADLDRSSLLLQDDETADPPEELQAAAEEGVDAGIAAAGEQGVDTDDEQRAAAIDAAIQAAGAHQDASPEHVRHAARGATHGALIQSQDVNVTQFQSAVGGSARGALSQHQSATVTQVQSAAWGASHGALSQAQSVTVEQVQYAARGAAAGAAEEAAETEIDHVGQIQEAAQGAAHGALSHADRDDVVQRQAITVEQVQYAARGAAAGVLAGVHEQHQRTDVEQVQRVSIKQVQAASMGAARGALVQRQDVTVEQTQAAARGAARGVIIVEQIQRVTVVQIQEAAVGASTGAIYQSQSATVEQIQAAATGAGHGVLIQRQEVTVTQIQRAARGASHGAVAGALQHQVVNVEQIQAAARGAGHGAVSQVQIIEITQIQTIARGSATGVLSMEQATTVQIYTAARLSAHETAAVVQVQRISITQIQRIAVRTATSSITAAVDRDTDDEDELREPTQTGASDAAADEEELDGDATIVFADQESDGQTVTVESASLENGGFVAIHSRQFGGSGASESVIGVSEYLEPGEHDEIEIELFDVPGGEFTRDALAAGTRTLYAVPHYDTNDNQQFDFVDTEGEDDPPYIGEDRYPVIDSADVTVTPDPDGTLDVEDQSDDGTNLTVRSASATVDFYLQAEYDDANSTSDTYLADETVENVTIPLDPPIEESTDVTVSVLATEDDSELASETINYTVEDDVELTANVTFEDQTSTGENVTVAEANLSAGGYVAVYETEDVSNSALENQGAEPDPERVIGVSEYLDPGVTDNVTVELFGDVVGTEFGDDSLEPGEHELEAVAHQETTDNETFDFVDTGGTEDGPYVDDDGMPISDRANVTVEELIAQFVVSDLEPEEATVTQGETIDVSATIENVGQIADTQTVDLRIDDEVIDDETVDLDAGANDSVLFENVSTDDLDPGQYVHGVYTEDDNATGTLTVEEAAPDPDPAFFEVSDVESNSPIETGETLTVNATIANVGDDEATQLIRLTLDEEEVDTVDATLEPGAADTVTLTHETTEDDIGNRTATVRTDDDEGSVLIEITAPPEGPVEDEQPEDPPEEEEEDDTEPADEDDTEPADEDDTEPADEDDTEPADEDDEEPVDENDEESSGENGEESDEAGEGSDDNGEDQPEEDDESTEESENDENADTDDGTEPNGAQTLAPLR